MDPDFISPEEEQSVEESILTLVDALPQPVQDFLHGKERNQIVAALSQKYNLHIDQAGEFERALLFMLLGVYTPTEFTDALAKAGLTQDIITGLTTDVNTQIFIRLRDAERTGSPSKATESVPPPYTAPQPVVTSPPPVPPIQFAPPVAAPTIPPPVVAVPLPVPQAPIAVPVSPPPPVGTAPVVPPIPAPLPIPPQPQPIYQAPPITPAPPLIPAPSPALPPYPPVRTMAGDMQTLAGIQNPPTSTQSSYAAPTIPPPPPIASIERPPAAAAVRPLTDYGVDPYRETPE